VLTREGAGQTRYLSTTGLTILQKRATREGDLRVFGVEAVFVRTWYKKDTKKELSREALARVRILTRR
jgi:hypothetical protein